MNDTGERRRAADKLPLDIESMIIEESDHKQRAFLIVLNSINQSLAANTKTVSEISAKLETHLDNFEQHTANEEAIFNKGRGAWKVTAWVLGAVQVLGLGIWQSARADLATINAALQTGQIQHVQFESRLNALERKQ